MDSGWVNFLQLGVWLDLGLVLDEVVRRRCAGLKVSKSAYYLPILPPPPPPPAQPPASLSRVAHFPQEVPTPTASSSNLLPFWKDQKFTSFLHRIEGKGGPTLQRKPGKGCSIITATVQGCCWKPMHFNGRYDGRCGKSQFNLMQFRALVKTGALCNVRQSQWEISIQSRAMACTRKNGCTIWLQVAAWECKYKNPNLKTNV